MSWMILTLVSSSLLGLYDVAKKVSVRGNAVPIVLLLSVTMGALIWGILLLLQGVLLPTFTASAALPAWLVVDAIDHRGHLALFAKAALVGASWTLAFHALKELPLSIAAPIRSTSPLWTLLIAIGFLGERPAPVQWVGIAVVLGSFWALSIVGSREGIRFRADRAVWWMLMGTILGAISAVYDKMLLQEFGYSPATVQAWFSIYLVPVMIPLAWRWQRVQRGQERIADRAGESISRKSNEFIFRASILLISPLLLAADMAYFTALSDPDALISIVSPLRRASVVVTLILSSRMTGELNLKRKGVCVLGILAGVVLLML